MPPRSIQAGLFRICQPCFYRIVSNPSSLKRSLVIDHRTRVSGFFIPTGGIAYRKDSQMDVHSTLIRAGYIRQPYSGFFHYLPLGQRVHEKVERLIDKHMRSVGASKLALSTVSSEELWQSSGRLEKGGNELFRFEDRKESKYLLSPTHEEEITTLVSSLVKSHKQLPLRLYQITRKYRDERRPRLGLMRGREFTMKDLYTFDSTEEAALETYKEVQGAYKALFEEIGLPYIHAEADSGNMGGSLSHEYHFPSPSGEDTVISCSNCGYCANEETAQITPPIPISDLEGSRIATFHGITKNRKTLINVHYPRYTKATNDGVLNEVHASKVKNIISDFDPSVMSALDLWFDSFVGYTHLAEEESYSRVVNIFDVRIPPSLYEGLPPSRFSKMIEKKSMEDFPIPTISITPDNPAPASSLNLLKIQDGDGCPKCEEGKLKTTGAIELGHTFHLGTRYTVPLRADVLNEAGEWKPMVMGCHGIGVSRMIPAIAEGNSDHNGLCWPRVVAPYDVVLVYGSAKKNAAVPPIEDIEAVYDVLASTGLAGGTGVDVILDDRDKDIVWKLKDAVLVGYPIMCVMGKSWESSRKIEIEVRKTKARLEVELGDLGTVIEGLLKEL
ncbi:prolyl-tRNA synthetase [Choiromyces venosus 120613-1]|uniref:proline--tRNA ligase n=1 Tax=Choiromyces venosus 120613-1 TaxID=1336337 RepID=A0A3N4JRW6_9PEZI|nr:prolyl-tRNA synthetase [Choiromyces venosus 120613-1]